MAIPTSIAPETTTIKNDAPIIHGIDVDPLLDPSELSSTTSMYDGLSDAIFEGIDDTMGDDDGTNDADEGALEKDALEDEDGTNDADEGTLEDALSMEKLNSFNARSCPNHSDKLLSNTKKG